MWSKDLVSGKKRVKVTGENRNENAAMDIVLYCIVLYSSIYIAPLNSHRQTEALLVRLAPRKETSFKK